MDPMRILSLLFSAGIFIFYPPLPAQSVKEIPLAYISPVPGARYVMPGTTLAFRQGEPFRASSVSRGLVEVSDPSGMRCDGNLVLTKDRRTLLFEPAQPFEEGANIRVRLNPGLQVESGRKIEPVTFDFTITEQVIPINYAFVERYILEKDHYGRKPQTRIPANTTGSKDTTLPAGLAVPDIWVYNQPPQGHYFYCPHDPWNLYPGNEPYIAISDAFGTLVYYKKMETFGYDLRIQHNGLLSYYTYHPEWGHVVMDSAFRYVDKYQMGNGYTYTDFHEFQLFENGHSFVMTFDAQLIDMSQIVPGGHPEATVMGFVMQELDADKNVIFEWRSWDHFEITDTGPEIDLTAENIDYVHGNTIEVESDTSILLSSRNMHEVTKIHRNTGEIIWRLGGSQNQFTFLGEDTLRFNRQHDSRRQPNGLISIFDNGTKRPEPQFSSVPEFNVNTEDSTATVVKRYRHDPDYFGNVMGNAYYTPDTTIVIGWGSCEPGITEIDPEGNTLFEMYFEAFNYRAYRFPWRTTYFTFDGDSLCLEYYENSNQVTAALTVRNPQDHPINLTGYSFREGYFDLSDTLPKAIPAGDSLNLTVRYVPDNSSYKEDVLTLNSDIDSDSLVQRIAQQIKLVAKQISGQSTGPEQPLDVRVYPNPVGDKLMIDHRLNGMELTAVLYDITGVEKGHWKFSEQPGQIRLGHLPSGMYTLHLRDREGNTTVLKIIRK